jgi:hypothetical protein
MQNFPEEIGIVEMCMVVCCVQMTQQDNWLPEAMSQATGMELEKLSLLGPFLSLSVFAEDNVSSTFLSFSFLFFFF